MDGNYGSIRDVLWPNATDVVWLNFSRRVVFSRLLMRTLRRTLTRQRLWANNVETLCTALFSKDSVLLWSVTTFSKNRHNFGQLQRDRRYQHLRWHELHTTAEAKRFLQDASAT